MIDVGNFLVSRYFLQNEHLDKYLRMKGIRVSANRAYTNVLSVICSGNTVIVVYIN